MKTSVIIVVLMILILFMTYNYMLNSDAQTITGAVTGVASVQVAGIVSISLTINSVNFGVVSAGGIDDTMDNAPLPFKIENSGNQKVNITIARDANSTPLFNGTGGGDNTESFQFMPGMAEAGSYDATCSPSNWTNIPGTTAVLAVCKLDSPASRDSVEIELKIAVPQDESVGTKTETLNFIAYQS